MLCSCGFKNPEKARFCQECGQKLIENITFEETNPGGIRKTLKSAARLMPKKNLGLNLLIVVIITILMLIIFSLISENMQDDTIISITAAGFCLLVITFVNQSFISSALNISRGNKVTFKETFTNTFKNGRKSVLSFIIYFLYFALMLLIIYLIDYLYLNNYINDLCSSLSVIIILILNFYLYPAIQFYIYESANREVRDENVMTLIKNGFRLAHKHRIEYYAMVISFYGWFILSIFTFGILYLWSLPYAYESLTNLYLHIKGEVKVKPLSTGITNDAVIGIFAGVIIALVLIISNQEETPINNNPYDYYISNL